MTIALSSAVEAAWWATLAGGLVVALVVWFLLEWLRRTVNDVERAVGELWTMGKRLAQNTATTHQLTTTAVLGTDLAKETQRHRDLAERRGA